MFLEFIYRPDTTYRKYKESVQMSLIDHPISQPSLDISPIWTPVIIIIIFIIYLNCKWVSTRLQ
jgi:hypothetical protein